MWVLDYIVTISFGFILYYLGAMITSLNDIETEIKSKIAVGNKCYYALRTTLKRRSISQSIKIRLYKTIIRPVVTQGHYNLVPGRPLHK